MSTADERDQADLDAYNAIVKAEQAELDQEEVVDDDELDEESEIAILAGDNQTASNADVDDDEGESDDDDENEDSSDDEIDTDENDDDSSQNEDDGEEESESEAEENEESETNEVEEEASKPTQNTIPHEAIAAERRARKKAERNSHELKDQLDGLNETIDSFKLQAKAAGIELNDGKIEFNDDTYIALVDNFDESTANLFMQMHNQIAKLSKANDTNKQVETDTSEDAPVNPYSREEVQAAISGNKHMKMWFAQAASGNTKAADIAKSIDKQFGVDDFESLDERLKEVARLTQLEIMKQTAGVKPNPKPKANKPARNLGDQSGANQSAGDLDRILAMSEADQLDAIQKLPAKRRAKVERALLDS